MLWVWLPVAAGCVSDSFEVELRPDGDALIRTLTWSRSRSAGQDRQPALAPEEIDRMAALFEEHLTPANARQQMFRGRFVGTMPKDVGGAGHFTRYASPLGSTAAYVERFRGVEDLNASVAQVQASADGLTDHLLAWLTKELSNEPGFDALRTFLDQEFRRDLKHIGLSVLMADVAADYRADLREEVVLRIGQHLVERGYVTPDELPGLARAVARNDAQAILARVARFAATKAGHAADDELPESWAFLSDPVEARRSLDAYLETTAEFQELLTAWEERRAVDASAERPRPDEVVQRLLADGLPTLRLFQRRDAVTVRLAVPLEPFATNGAWDDRRARVVWSSEADEHDVWPTFCYCLWSEPDAAYQERTLGRVAVTGRELADYVMWYRGLSADEAAEWDAALAELQPGDDVEQRLAGFFFAAERTAGMTDPSQSLAARGREILVSALKTGDGQ
jgi:hypothetical protein